MKLKFLIILISLGFSSVFSQKNCYTIAVGKKASYDQKRVLVAHNEDDSGDLIINMFKVPSEKHNKTDKYTLIDGTKIPQAENTN
jgi:dipeptidase